MSEENTPRKENHTKLLNFTLRSEGKPITISIRPLESNDLEVVEDLAIDYTKKIFTDFSQTLETAHQEDSLHKPAYSNVIEMVTVDESTGEPLSPFPTEPEDSLVQAMIVNAFSPSLTEESFASIIKQALILRGTPKSLSIVYLPTEKKGFFYSYWVTQLKEEDEGLLRVSFRLAYLPNQAKKKYKKESHKLLPLIKQGKIPPFKDSALNILDNYFRKSVFQKKTGISTSGFSRS